MIKKITGIVIFILTLVSLYFMSKGLVGIPLAYALIFFHIARLLAEMVAVRVISDKLNIRSDIKIEVPRKFAHIVICLITVPMIYHSFKGTIHLIIMLFIISAIIAIADKIGFANKIATRSGEGSDNIASIYYLLIGFAINSIISLFIPIYNPCVLLGVVALGLGDPLACIFGKLFGKHKFKNGKTIEGFIAFIVGSVIAMYVATGVVIWQLIIIGLVGALIELYSGECDNLLIQLGTGLTSFLVLLFL